MITQTSNAASVIELSLPISADSIANSALFGRQDESTLRSETAAIRELSHIVEDEHASLTRFLHVTLKSCSANTAGVTLLEHGPPGKPALRWDAIAGELAAQEGFAPPRNFSSCGMCLDRAEPLLLTEPQRVFTYLGEMSPSISELLVIPLHDGLQPLGTLWMAQHDPTQSFCADDARVAERLALHLASALKLSLRAKEHRRAMAYRDAQLQDAHHRVKNTLQIAVSTLELDAHATTSDSARVALRIGIGRLRILAKVHELLGHETGSEQIAVHTLLHSVVEAALHSFVEITGRVALKLTAVPVWLPADQAIPMALLANESITNACKHAFPAGRTGEICVELSGTPASTLILSIADDGVGIAKRHPSGLGLQLIAGFSEQLRGSLTISTPADAQGTTVVLTVGHEGKASACI